MSESRIKGAVICRRCDEFGEIIVAEEGDTRTLYFGEGITQSTILSDRPDVLLEDYHEAMMCALMFKTKPGSLLLIGLGGCSMVHFLLKALPECTLDVVEIRREVIDLAGEYFQLPPENPRLRIVHASGSEFIGSRETDSGNYDMILVDAFDEKGPAAALLEQEFLSSCRTRLHEGGVFVINLWNSPGHDFPAMYSSVRDAFGSNALKLLLAESYRNAVAFGFENPSACRDLPGYRGSASELRRKYGINFPRYLKYLYWQNFDEQEQ